MLKEYKTLLKNWKFLYVWVSQILSQLTVNIMNFILLLKLFFFTKSTIATSFLWISYALPAIFIGPIGAASVDYYDRRKMLMVTNLLQALTVLTYALVHKTNPFLLYTIAFSYSLLNQFYVPAEAASIPQVVKKDDLPQANSLFFLTQQISLIAGFSLAGIFNHVLGFEISLFLCALLLFIAFISVSFLPRLVVKKHFGGDFEAKLNDFFRSIVEGYQYIKGNRFVLLPLLLVLSVEVIVAIAMVNAPVIATEIMQINLNSAGLAIAAPAGLGALVGALVLPKLFKKGWRKKKVIERSLMISSLSFFTLNFAAPVFSHPYRLVFSVAAIVFLGISFVGIMIPAQTLIQEITPKELFGRVFGNLWFLVTIATVFPILFSGTLTDILGIRFLLALITFFSLTAFIIANKYGKRIAEKNYG